MAELSDMEYKIERADIRKHGDDVIGFWKSLFPAWNEAKYKFFYQNNPQGEAITFLVRHDDFDLPLGAISLFPRRVMIEGRPYTVGMGGDLAVSPDHRRRGLAMGLRKSIMDHMDEGSLAFLYGTPNDRSARITVRAGYKIIGKACTMVKVLKSQDYTRRLLKVGFLSKPAAWPIDTVLRLKSREGRYPLAGDYGIEIVTEFDHRIDDLWIAARENYPVIGERTSDILNWRFGQNPYNDFTGFLLVNKQNNSLAGYIVYRNSDLGVHISDFFPRDFEQSAGMLLAAFVRYMRAQGEARLSFYYLGLKRVQELFESFGFVPRHDKRSLIVYTHETADYYQCVNNPGCWHFTESDNDVV